MRQGVPWVRLGIGLSTARLPALGVLLVGVTLVLVEPGDRSRWLGYAADTGMYLSVLSFAIAGSFFAVSGYLTALRGLVHAPELARTARSRTQVVLLRVTGDLTWLVSALLIFHVAAYARTALAAGGVEPHGWSLSVLGLSSASMCYGIGLVLGRVGRHVLGLFPVAVLPYALTLGADEVALSPASRFQHLVGPFVDQSWGVALLPDHGAVLLLAAYAGCAAATLVALGARAVRAREPGGWRPVVVPLVGAVTAGAVLVAAFPGTRFSHPRDTPVVCDPTAVVCVRDALGGQRLDTWQEADGAVRAALGDAARPELRFTEPGVPVEGYVELPVPPWRVSSTELAGLMLREHVEAVVRDCRDEEAATSATVALYELVVPALDTPDPSRVAQDVQRVIDGCRDG